MSQQKMVLQPILRLWLGLFSGLLLLSAISAFHGEYWYFGDKQAFYAAKAGEVSVHELYTPAKILFAFIVSTIPPLLWLLLVNRRAPRLLTHTLPSVLLLLAGLLFFFLRPDVIPGGETPVYRYGERERYYQTIRWQKPEPGAWRGTRSEYNVYIEYRDPRGYRKVDNIKNAYTCETHRESRFFTLTTEEDWYPDSYPNILEAPCQAIKDPQAMTEYTRDHARWFPITF
ncbi:TPA: hypothetical protein ACXG9J_000870 [Klebsiella pneumoniae]|uniref:hypothetical protein n=1 Tax=Klebsiella TaxID=570 RepID=UPI0004612B88|nr:hypothetical protein [Klebsiella pneumoniae]AXS34573.1 hypothetical protein D0897_05995 [Klebsiella pneumoniae]AYY33857.1 hypothetical protein EGX99_17995 [Klebsiella pneumoniae]EIV7909041.1 hypothetical protein [Klebsiella pneumoniae]EIW8653593.1 hypothetical protein [Klebsiella pneumoniae]EIX9171137.1 hypothetical protein [Klebsiella pneumoniae]